MKFLCPSDHLGNSEMTAKMAFWIILWGASWSLVIFTPWSGLIKFPLALLHMLTHVFIALNIGHDANHNAITRNRFLASLYRRSFDLVGISSYCWRINHNRFHHHYTSVSGHDSTTNGKGVLRFQETEKKFFHHRFQHFYAPFVYGLVTLNYIFHRDFADFFRDFRSGPVTVKVLTAFIESLVFKIFYLSYTLVIPLLILPFSAFQVVGTFLFAHFLLGLIIVLIQVPHFNTRTRTVGLDDISPDWDRNLDFILKHTADIAPQSKYLNWLLGGVNTHIVHHIYPQVCHVHLPAMTSDLMKACALENKNYPSFDSLPEGYLSHLRYLKNLGEN